MARKQPPNATTSQRAIFAAREAVERREPLRKAAHTYNVSSTIVGWAVKLVAHHPKLAASVARGSMTINQAAREAKLKNAAAATTNLTEIHHDRLRVYVQTHGGTIQDHVAAAVELYLSSRPAGGLDVRALVQGPGNKEMAPASVASAQEP